MLESLLAHGDDTIMLVNADGSILFANRVLAGLTAEELVGSSLFSLLPELKPRTLPSSASRRVPVWPGRSLRAALE